MKCEYCEESELLAKCLDCDKYFCNKYVKRNGSHIILHIQMASHNRVSIENKLLNCRKCKDANIFDIGKILQETGSDDMFICRSTCLLIKNKYILRDKWQPLIIEKQIYKPVLGPPMVSEKLDPKKEMIRIKEIHQQEELLENKNPKDDPIFIRKVKPLYKDKDEYVGIMCPLVKIEETTSTNEFEDGKNRKVSK
eukprot:GHVP01021426.1.p1 GENE.GHVP01021426.1~~GHVP01021426.1.p1  ORF type:complete len:195 (-),score=31.59 GHVP01021426.1:386-970(-)